VEGGALRGVDVPALVAQADEIAARLLLSARRGSAG